MKRWILVVLFLSIAHAAALRAEPFEKAEVTETINIASLLSEDKPPKPAQTGDVITGKTALKTGGLSDGIAVPGPNHHSRRLQFALLAYWRRTRDGFEWRHHVLFSSPKGAGEGKVQAGSVTVEGSEFLISNIGGRVKVISLIHKVLVYFTANPEIRFVLHPGQKVDIAARATKMPPVMSTDPGVQPP